MTQHTAAGLAKKLSAVTSFPIEPVNQCMNIGLVKTPTLVTPTREYEYVSFSETVLP